MPVNAAWRALIPEAAFPPDIHRELFEYMSFCLPPGEQFLGYPVTGPDDDLRPGHRRYNVVWYRPADEATELRQLLTDERGTVHAISIPPPLIRRAAIDDMRAAAELGAVPRGGAADRRTDPAADLRSRHAAHGVRRVAIIGDAGFLWRGRMSGQELPRRRTMRPPWWLLADGEVEPALRRFEAVRQPVGMRIIERARHLGAYLQATQTAEERARSQRHSIPEAVMAETAVIDFLRASIAQSAGAENLVRLASSLLVQRGRSAPLPP